MTDIIAIVICYGLLSFGIGLVTGRISTAPEPRPAPVGLSNAAIAHIVHEAIRAYERSLGVIRAKTWNNVNPKSRELLIERINLLRGGKRSGRRVVPRTGTAGRIEQAIIDLVR